MYKQLINLYYAYGAQNTIRALRSHHSVSGFCCESVRANTPIPLQQECNKNVLRT